MLGPCQTPDYQLTTRSTFYNSLGVLVGFNHIYFSTFMLQFSFQEKKRSSPPKQRKNVQCSSISEVISDSSKLTRKEDFFIFTKEQEKEVDPR